LDAWRNGGHVGGVVLATSRGRRRERFAEAEEAKEEKWWRWLFSCRELPKLKQNKN